MPASGIYICPGQTQLPLINLQWTSMSTLGHHAFPGTMEDGLLVLQDP